MALRRCSRCPELVPVGTSMCPECKAKSDRARGTSTQRGYGTRHRKTFREGVLARDPICVICRAQPATVADHWPLSRRELVERGLDADDPQYGRGLCKQDHDRETARNQPGGWHA